MLTRDSLVWTLGLVAAVLGYLVTAEKPPTEWGYMQWLQAGTFVVAWIMGRLSSSPLAGADTHVSRTKIAWGGLVKLTDKETR
jgi:hypothetical protein